MKTLRQTLTNGDAVVLTGTGRFKLFAADGKERSWPVQAEGQELEDVSENMRRQWRKQRGEPVSTRPTRAIQRADCMRARRRQAAQ